MPNVICSLSCRMKGKPRKDPETGRVWMETSWKAFTPKNILTLDEFINQVTVVGRAFIPVFKHGKRAESNFMATNVVALDFDNDPEISPINTWTIDEILEDSFVKQYASFIYTTPSHNEIRERFRVVFILDKCVLDVETYKGILIGLINKFQGADGNCQHGSQIFYGCVNSARVEKILNVLPTNVAEDISRNFVERRSPTSTPSVFRKVGIPETEIDSVVEEIRGLLRQCQDWYGSGDPGAPIDWYKIAWSVYYLFPNQIGIDLLCERWGEESRSKAEELLRDHLRKIDNGDTNDLCTIGTLIYYARDPYDTKNSVWLKNVFQQEYPNIVKLYKNDKRESGDFEIIDDPLPEIENSLPLLPILKLFDDPPPPPKWVFKDLIEQTDRTTLIMLNAAEKSGKSWLSYVMVLSIISGKPFMDKYNPAPHLKNVLVISPEGGSLLVKKRLWGLAAKMDEMDLSVLNERLHYVDLSKNTIDLGNRDHLRLLKNTVDTLEIDVVLIDPMIEMGSFDENDNNAMANFISGWRKVAENRDVVFIYTHHNTKGKTTARGAGSILGKYDFNISMERLYRASDRHEARLYFNSRMTEAPKPLTFWWKTSNPDNWNDNFHHINFGFDDVKRVIEVQELKSLFEDKNEISSKELKMLIKVDTTLKPNIIEFLIDNNYLRQITRRQRGAPKFYKKGSEFNSIDYAGELWLNIGGENEDEV